MPFGLGGGELIVILVIVLVVFGAGRLPEVLGQMGKGVNEFKKAASGEDRHEDQHKDAEPKSTTPPEQKP